MAALRLRSDGRYEVADTFFANRDHGCQVDDWCILADDHDGPCDEDREVWAGPDTLYMAFNSHTNRALVEFRRTPLTNREAQAALSFARYTETTGVHWGWTEAELSHASRVLRRLAAFWTDGQVA